MSSFYKAESISNGKLMCCCQIEMTHAGKSIKKYLSKYFGTREYKSLSRQVFKTSVVIL